MKKLILLTLFLLPLTNASAWFDDIYKCSVDYEASLNPIDPALPETYDGLSIVKVERDFFIKVSPEASNGARYIKVLRSMKFSDRFNPMLEFVPNEYDFSTGLYLKGGTGILSSIRYKLEVDLYELLIEEASFNIRVIKDSSMGVAPRKFDVLARCSFYD